MAEFRSNYEINKMINSGEPFPSRGFKNYIINGDFSIWQRGESFSDIPNDTYTSDRWIVRKNGGTGNNSITKDSIGNFSAIKYTENADGSSFSSIEQKIEGVKRLSGKTMTLSFLVESNHNIISNFIYIRVYHDSTSTTIELPYTVNANTITKVEKTFTLADMTSWDITGYDYLYIFIDGYGGTNGHYFKIAQVQLEEGSVATPFERTDPAVELLRCQRYYWRGSPSVGSGYLSSHAAVTGLKAFDFSFPIAMRTTPTMAIITSPTLTNCTYNDISGNQNGFSIRVNTSGATTCRALGGIYEASAEL